MSKEAKVNMNKRLTCKISEPLYTWFQKHCEDHSLSIGRVINKLIGDLVKNPSTLGNIVSNVIVDQDNWINLAENVTTKGWYLPPSVADDLSRLAVKSSISKNTMTSLLLANYRLEVLKKEAQDD